MNSIQLITKLNNITTAKYQVRLFSPEMYSTITIHLPVPPYLLKESTILATFAKASSSKVSRQSLSAIFSPSGSYKSGGILT